MPDPKEDGSLYARGDTLMLHPKRSARGISMGGRVAECRSPEAASELARVHNLARDLHEALRLGAATVEVGEFRVELRFGSCRTAQLFARALGDLRKEDLS